ncbi:olfactory receptor 1E1-like [Erpetoichthys calabaricus]|uniref:olfactory receptor 1E1-like n=1 Tax=Erpetoichthys calabaricus TaxID=27687 RepID=UPI002234A1B9|nr:olfactory receptor 1E1-like [Erpetoichthys calabaricus]
MEEWGMIRQPPTDPIDAEKVQSEHHGSRQELQDSSIISIPQILLRGNSPGMNQTTVSTSEFVLLCRIDSQKKSYTIAILTMIYLMTLIGNFLVILAIVMNPQLQKPMYIGIATLAAIDLVGGAESFLLGFMACDRYVAVVYPLRYSAILTKRTIWAAGPGMNQTLLSVSEFVLLCTVDSQKKSYTIAILIMVYLLTLFGNVLVVLVIAINPQLQKPMYVGIATLAVIDLVGSTNITPKLIAVLSDWTAIPYGPCLLQMLVVLYLEATESYLLVFMACDRYVAVVYPLQYSALITKRTVWVAVILLSYTRIAYAALKIPSIDGKRKTFNTLITHLLVVGLSNIPLFISYTLTGVGVKLSTESNNAMIIVANIVPPMFNPMIYSFRNKEIRGSILKLFKSAKCEKKCFKF